MYSFQNSRFTGAWGPHRRCNLLNGGPFFYLIKIALKINIKN
jgi:hypothetical protein